MFFESRLRKVGGRSVLALVVMATVLFTNLLLHPKKADAVGDERTLSFFEIHTGRRLTVTFKRNGKFIPEALKKINWFMRDWRRNLPTRMDPHLIDLVWQLHEESGSKKPVHVVSGYRSPKTNAALRRRGGGQAKRSQHMRGKAMDIHFPDVPMSEVRKLAFKLQIGGVGYYPTSAIPFVHVDTARVRAWPRMSRMQLAMLFPYGRTKHRPARGGPLTLRDQKRARIRLAAIARKKANRARILVARNSIPALDRRNSFARSSNAQGPGTLQVPGLSHHARRLWINQNANNQRPAAQPRKQVQLAALTPQEVHPKAPAKSSNLWVDGSGLRASWLQEDEQNSAQDSTQQPAPKQPRPSIAPTPSGSSQRHETIRSKSFAKPAERSYQAERVAYAPSFDEEHPDELAYRPFRLLPLMKGKPIALDKTLVTMSEPQYDRIYEVIASSENLHMQFRPSAQDAQALWNSQFEGQAIINIRKQADDNNLVPAKPTRMASTF